MVDLLLPLHHDLQHRSRAFPLWQRGSAAQVLELGILALAGFAAAAITVLVELNLRIPGSAVFRSVFPLVCGLGLVPRRGAGTFMGTSALISALMLPAFGYGDAGVGALTSLTLTGPLLDAALWRAQRGRSIFLAFAVAGCLSNLAAFVVRGIAKLGTDQFAGGRLFEMWLAPAAISYPLCGALAGVLSALVWFQIAPRTRKTDESSGPSKSPASPKEPL